MVSDKMGSKRRSSDIISLLVSIYGSKDIFIDEYRAVLADRLLHQLNYNTARYEHRLQLRVCFLLVLKSWITSAALKCRDDVASSLVCLQGNP